jgi:hypothetical protein
VATAAENGQSFRRNAPRSRRFLLASYIGCPKNDIRAGCPLPAARDLEKSGRTTFVQKLLVESGCRMSQRRSDFYS